MVLRTTFTCDGGTLVLTDALALEPDEGGATARFTLAGGERAAFTLRHGEGLDAELAGTVDTWVALAETIQGWRSWVTPHPRPGGPAVSRAVTRSTLVLAALSYAQGLERAGGRLCGRVRLRRAGRRGAADAAGRVPARSRRADAAHDRRG